MIGVQCLSGTLDTLDLVTAGSRIVKLVDGAFHMAADVLRVAPDCLVIGRAYEALDPLSDWYPGTSARAAAEEWLRRQWPRVAANPLIKIWEGPNEPNCDTPERGRWYADFEVRRMELMQTKGLRCVIGCFGCGRPPLPNENGTWQAFVPALMYARERGHYLGLHEYSWPAMQSAVTWLCLRYRRVYNWLPAEARAKLLITECGLDPSASYNGRPDGGGAFRDGEWRTRYGGSEPDETYFQQLKWYDGELRKDPYVAGATVFTCGDDGHWGGFDIAGTPVVGKLAAYLRDRKEPPPPVTRFVQGIDTNHHRGPSDMAKVKAAGYQFAYHRATYGALPENDDRVFLHDRASSLAAGLPYGAYGYIVPWQNAVDQARHFYAVAGPGQLPSAVDVEEQGLSILQVEQWVDEYERLSGRRDTLIYTAPNTWNTAARADPDRARRMAARCRLWIADPDPVERPTLPFGWNDFPLGKSWIIWQHSWTGNVPGVQPPTDLDRVNGTLKDLQELADMPVITINLDLTDAEVLTAQKVIGLIAAALGGGPPPPPSPYPYPATVITSGVQARLSNGAKTRIIPIGAPLRVTGPAFIVEDQGHGRFENRLPIESDAPSVENVWGERIRPDGAPPPF